MRASTLKFLVKIATVFAVLVLFTLVLLLTFQYVKINQLETRENELNLELLRLQQSYENYENEYTYIQTHYNDYVEDYVREVLGWGRSSEIKFQNE